MESHTLWRPLVAASHATPPPGAASTTPRDALLLYDGAGLHFYPANESGSLRPRMFSPEEALRAFISSLEDSCQLGSEDGPAPAPLALVEAIRELLDVKEATTGEAIVVCVPSATPVCLVSALVDLMRSCGRRVRAVTRHQPLFALPNIRY